MSGPEVVKMTANLRASIIFVTISSSIFLGEYLSFVDILRIPLNTSVYVLFTSMLLWAGGYLYHIVTKSTMLRIYSDLFTTPNKDELLFPNFSRKYVSVIGIPVEIYAINHPSTMRFTSPVFSMTVNGPKIFVNKNFITNLDENTMEAVLLHELGHLVYKDQSTAMKLMLTLYLCVIETTSAAVFFTIVRDSFFFAFMLMSTIITTIISIKLVAKLLVKEYRADKFAATLAGGAEPVISAINETYEFIYRKEFFLGNQKLKKMQKRRLKHLKMLNKGADTNGFCKL